MTPEHAARIFCEQESDFHLGFLPTEQAHPKTRQLAHMAQTNTEAACRLLLAVDAAMLPVLRNILALPECAALCSRLEATIRSGGRIILSGCGATGRLCLLLEAAWHGFWKEQPVTERRYDQALRAIMTGGDYAFIRSVESFEDYAAFGARQAEELDIGPADCLVGISEGGETSSVLGSIQAARQRGASAAFICNNPHALLRERIERSRQVLDDDAIIALDCCTGPMALTGSTRMQATTAELLVVGAMLEQVATTISAGHAATVAARPGMAETLARFERLATALMQPDNLAALGHWVGEEAAVYAQAGAITYFAENAWIDILTDTTERTPTFATPPFSPRLSAAHARPWAMVKNLTWPTHDVWNHMLGRKPVCLEWRAADYRAMGADRRLIEHPPRIDRAALYEFTIGNEPDAGRHRHPSDTAILVLTSSDTNCASRLEALFEGQRTAFAHFLQVNIHKDRTPSRASSSNAITLACPLPPSPLRLIEHLALKLICNTVSTVTMARLGRVTGNWMTHVQPTNKKLIDRACRILCDSCGMTYAEACTELFRELAADPRPMSDRPSPVHAILQRRTQSAAAPWR